jgi:hypothetical protein
MYIETNRICLVLTDTISVLGPLLAEIFSWFYAFGASGPKTDGDLHLLTSIQLCLNFM